MPTGQRPRWNKETREFLVDLFEKGEADPFKSHATDLKNIWTNNSLFQQTCPTKDNFYRNYRRTACEWLQEKEKVGKQSKLILQELYFIL